MLADVAGLLMLGVFAVCLWRGGVELLEDGREYAGAHVRGPRHAKATRLAMLRELL